jgi:hypothetical protein
MCEGVDIAVPGMGSALHQLYHVISQEREWEPYV